MQSIKVIIRTPVANYNGISAGVNFVNGVATMSDAQLTKTVKDYFVKNNYTIDLIGAVISDVTPTKRKAKK